MLLRSSWDENWRPGYARALHRARNPSRGKSVQSTTCFAGYTIKPPHPLPNYLLHYQIDSQAASFCVIGMKDANSDPRPSPRRIAYAPYQTQKRWFGNRERTRGSSTRTTSVNMKIAHNGLSLPKCTHCPSNTPSSRDADPRWMFLQMNIRPKSPGSFPRFPGTLPRSASTLSRTAVPNSCAPLSNCSAAAVIRSPVL